MNLIAKPIVKNQYWVVTDGNKKVGNVISDGSGYDVKIGNNITHYPTTKAIINKTKIEFVKNKEEKKVTNPIFATFPTGSSKIYNSVLDIKRKIHLFTKTAKSKCFHAAGWFAVKQGQEFVPILAPKYIFIQRYEYHGPYMTEDEAKNVINTL
jgi:hypothetical protein